MNEVKDLMLNMLIIILPIFIYQTIWIDKISSPMVTARDRTAISIVATVAALCCMTLPVTPLPGFVFDLRLVPLLIGILYGGFRSSLFLIAAVYLYSWYLGGPGFPIMALTYPFVILAAYLISSRFKRWGRRQKLLSASLLTFFASLLVKTAVVVTAYLPQPDTPQLPIIAAFVILHVLSICISIFLIENMREKAALRFEIQQAEKLRIMGQLAASIAHEVRNPLTVVRGFLQLLQSDQIPAEKRHMFLKLGIDELDRSETIISNYLAFAKPQSSRLETIDVAERVEHAAAIISSYATLQNVEIKHQIAQGLYIAGDPEQLSQVLMNLVKNGIEAMPNGGTLHMNAYKRGQNVKIDIIDNGVGMSEAELERVGTPYFSTKQNGTGLGLMVTYQIIHSMQGTVQVKSVPGKGTQFMLTFPQNEKNALPD
ncbi:hypothetical protein CIG75_16595 [Tumebacillus algifaecis]|uniref:histidine kinase n=1 Tax=Tumebacillus algifaecis TaxID=1214604 RepID=A0A223D4Y7_9BACL|nr:ATP-binding protein [Tumebacillus algifaecis]ASS76414.1 hypothetical protein CIG75_16595 [Tumebacillus algifaecis]